MPGSQTSTAPFGIVSVAPSRDVDLCVRAQRAGRRGGGSLTPSFSVELLWTGQPVLWMMNNHLILECEESQRGEELSNTFE